MPDVADTFKAPYPPIDIPRPLLVTAEEISKAKGKLKSITKLRKNPRAQLPELQLQINALVNMLNQVVRLRNVPYDEEKRREVDFSKAWSRLLEEIVIRVVIHGEAPTEAFESVQQRVMVAAVEIPPELLQQIVQVGNKPIEERPS